MSHAPGEALKLKSWTSKVGYVIINPCPLGFKKQKACSIATANKGMNWLLDNRVWRLEIDEYSLLMAGSDRLQMNGREQPQPKLQLDCIIP